jgi:hypothetical protein
MKTKMSKRAYRVIIRREECFEIEADTAEEAVDIAFDSSWMCEGDFDEPGVVTHRCDVIDDTVEEIDRAAEEQGSACDRERC